MAFHPRTAPDSFSSKAHVLQEAAQLIWHQTDHLDLLRRDLDRRHSLGETQCPRRTSSREHRPVQVERHGASGPKTTKLERRRI